MNTITQTTQKQGFMYQGRFSASLDFESLREKISSHLQFIRSQKNEPEESQSISEIEHSGKAHELN